MGDTSSLTNGTPSNLNTAPDWTKTDLLLLHRTVQVTAAAAKGATPDDSLAVDLRVGETQAWICRADVRALPESVRQELLAQLEAAQSDLVTLKFSETFLQLPISHIERMLAHLRMENLDEAFMWQDRSMLEAGLLTEQDISHFEDIALRDYGEEDKEYNLLLLECMLAALTKKCEIYRDAGWPGTSRQRLGEAITRIEGLIMGPELPDPDGVLQVGVNQVRATFGPA